MELSKEAETILSMCWRFGERASTNFYIGEKYISKTGENFKPTENTYEELVKYQETAEKPVKIFRSGNYVNITGGTIVK